MLTACAIPAKKFDLLASKNKLRRIDLSHTALPISAYVNHANALGTAASPYLRIYLSGDGLPWVNRRWVSKDPTPLDPVILKLIRHDLSPALLLGRPCYHQLITSQLCDSRYWTSHRYSSEVVAVMLTAIKQLNIHNANIELIGYSGGGALAMLLAERLPKVVAVVTIAGNLDTGSWTDLHAYTSLYQSINPASRPVLSSSIRQLHLMGDLDTNIPTSLTIPMAQRQIGAEIWVLPNYSHTCCWDVVWPKVIDWLNQTKET